MDDFEKYNVKHKMKMRQKDNPQLFNEIYRQLYRTNNRKFISNLLFIIIAFIAVLLCIIIACKYYIIPNQKYNNAIKLYTSEKYKEAYEVFNSLNYKDSRSKAKEALFNKQISRLYSVNVGETIYLGAYEQDNNQSNGREEIEWFILTKKDDKALIVSKYVLDCQPYNDKYNEIAWKSSSMRKWLKESFYIKAFGPQYENIISDTEIYEKSSDKSGATIDNIFLLSENEVANYLKNDDMRKGIPTDYALSNGVNVCDEFSSENELTSWWWLRSYKNDDDYITAVNVDSSLFYLGDCVGYINGGVRPAMWINIKNTTND